MANVITATIQCRKQTTASVKDPNRYAVQVSDTTMLTNASQPEQKILCKSW